MPEPSTLTVLRTAAGSAVAPFVIRALRRIEGVRVVAADSDPLSCGFAFADRSVVVPRADSPEYVAALLDVCEREAADWLFPDLDEELPLLARERKRFEERGTRVVLSEARAIERTVDKLETARFLGERGFPTPKTWLAADFLAGRDGGFPLILKPRRGRGGAGVRRVDGAEELDFHRRRNPDLLAQEWLRGTEYTIDTLSDLQGRFLYASVRERIATDSGISIKGRTARHPGIEGQVRAIAEALPLSGPACVQGIDDGSGIRFTEVNPRLGGGVALSIAAGAPILSDLVRLLRGEPPVGPTDFRAGLVMLRHWEEVFIDEEHR